MDQDSKQRVGNNNMKDKDEWAYSCIVKDCKERIVLVDPEVCKAWCYQHKPPLDYVIKG